MFHRIARALIAQFRMGIVQDGSGVHECIGTITVDQALAAEAARYRAQMESDFAALDRLYGADLVYAHSSTLVDTKASFIESMRSGVVGYRKMTLGDVTVRCYGGVAIIAGQCTFDVTVQGNEITNDLQFHSVWVMRTGGPQFVSWQATRLAAKA